MKMAALSLSKLAGMLGGDYFPGGDPETDVEAPVFGNAHHAAG